MTDSGILQTWQAWMLCTQTHYYFLKLQIFHNTKFCVKTLPTAFQLVKLHWIYWGCYNFCGHNLISPNEEISVALWIPFLKRCEGLLKQDTVICATIGFLCAQLLSCCAKDEMLLWWVLLSTKPVKKAHCYYSNCCWHYFGEDKILVLAISLALHLLLRRNIRLKLVHCVNPIHIK